MSMKNNHHKKVVEAAGGVLWKETLRGKKIAIIHRSRYDDWTLPKGKRDRGESWQETALREVWEETGCRANLGGFIGATAYTINGYTTPKVVLFWHMNIQKNCEFTPNDEVDCVKWISPKKALKKLTHENECKILRKAIASQREA
jgi:8-oxo-dGTP diphosphatase